MTITKTLIKLNDRFNFLPKHCGNKHMSFENHIFHLANQYFKNYDGGYWEFYELSNGGFYISLKTDSTIIFDNPENYFVSELDSQSASIVLNLYAMSNLSFRYPDIFSEKYHQLYDFALDHENASLIRQAID